MSVFMLYEQYFKLVNWCNWHIPHSGIFNKSITSKAASSNASVHDAGEEQKKRLGPLTAGANKNWCSHVCPAKKPNKQTKNGADEHENTNHVECNSGVHQWQACTLPGRPSLVTGARTDKFGLSFWGLNSCMSAYHSMQGERGGEGEHTKQKNRGTERRKREGRGEQREDLSH